MATRCSLDRYTAKRDFGRTTEPPGRRRASRRRAGPPQFVVQKHDATSLHYDFRLEADGVLKSWAVPKGPSLNPADKQLAMPTEDHPLDYATFEGVIPKGQYGAGTVEVWDLGTYQNRTERGGEAVPVEQAVEDGHVSVWLDGHKLHGGFALTRTRAGKKESWLLVKKKDEAARTRTNLLRSRPESVLSGRTVEEIAAQET